VEYLGTSADDIGRAGAYIRAGELVVWHSERYYGLCANGLDEAAVQRIYRAKRRDAGEALAVHALDVDDARRYGVLNALAVRLVEGFWPGYLSLVVEKTDAVPDYVTSGMRSVLLSCVNGLGHEIPAAARTMVVSSSANISGTPPATTMEEVREFAANAGDRIAAVVGDGPCPINAPTTIISTVTDPATILREGVVTAEEIRKIAPDTIVKERVKKRGASAGGRF
jgi:L-threonylcarbamoyladenylate synthase